jgi:nucleoside-diphosphate-sugar epimerase
MVEKLYKKLMEKGDVHIIGYPDNENIHEFMHIGDSVDHFKSLIEKNPEKKDQIIDLFNMRFKKYTLEDAKPIIEKILKKEIDKGLELRVCKSTFNPENVYIEFIPTPVDRVGKKMTEKEFNNYQKFWGHHIEIGKDTGFITLGIGNRGTTSLSEEQRKYYSDMVRKLREDSFKKAKGNLKLR